MRLILNVLLICVGTMLPAARAEDGRVFSLLDPPQQTEMIRCGVDPDDLDTFLALDQHTFDQSFDGEGWRDIGRPELTDCGVAQAAVIEAYLLYSRPHPVESQKILRWHAAQALAGSGETRRAIAFFRGTYDRPDADRGGAWNLYADATIAFLEDDYEALIAARDALAALKPSEETIASKRAYFEQNPEFAARFGDWETMIFEPPNLSVVEELVECFGQPYEDAYGQCEASSSP